MAAYYDSPSESSPTTRMTESNIVELIRRAAPTLKRGGARVAQTVLADPAFVTQASLAELSAKAEVSEPTVLRFCAGLGCSGFSQFKMRIATSLALGAPMAHSQIHPTDDTATVARKIFDHTITSLDWTRRHLDIAAITSAVELLFKARRIEFYGFGASGIVAQDAQQKFPLFGVPCVVHQDSHQQLISASMLTPTDAVVAISNTGSTRSLIENVRVARERGAKIVVITGSDSPITRYADVSIIAETLENTNVYTPTTSRIAALVIVDILSTAVSVLRGDSHQQEVGTMKRRLAEARSTGVI